MNKLPKSLIQDATTEKEKMRYKKALAFQAQVKALIKSEIEEALKDIEWIDYD